MHVHATEKKIQHKLNCLKSKTRHLSRFCNSKVTDKGSKVISRRMSGSMLMIARLTSLP